MRNGFSFASVILSYFLVAGGMFTGLLLAVMLKTDAQGLRYLFMGLGGFLGGFLAARASRGETIVEPAIGAVALVITLVAVGASTTIGELLWLVSAKSQIYISAGAVIVGALGGAFASEKMFGEPSTSALPWIIYVAGAAFGACELVYILAVAFVFDHGGDDAAAGAMFGGMGLGCLLSGIAAGAMARTRPLLASLVGAAIGMAGFFLLIIKLFQVTASEVKADNDVIGGLAIISIMGGIVSLIGALIGWFAVGKKRAG